MATSSGGGPEFMSTLNVHQKKLMKELAGFLSGRISDGATPSEIDPVSGEEQDIFNRIFALATDTTDTDLARTTLSGIARGEGGPQEITEEASREFFQKGVANPLLKDVEERLLPEARRSVAGFSTRRARAVRNVLQDATETLAGEASRIELARQQINASIAQNRVANMAGAATALPALNAQRAGFLSSAGAIASDFTNRRRAEEARGFEEHNPFIGHLQSTIALQTGQIVQQPAKTTGFGTALGGLSALGAAGTGFGTGAAAMQVGFGNDPSALFGSKGP